MTIREHVQRHALGVRVTLYELDLTLHGLGIVRIVGGSKGPASMVRFGGEDYSPHPIKTDGWEVAAGGSLPRPTFTVANLDNSFTALVEDSDDLHGSTLRRIRTYDRYLDDGPEPDGDSHLPIDVYELSQKTEHTQDQITWQCTAAMDQEDVVLPARIAARDYCTHDTRVWDPVANAFDYSLATCPYTGAAKDINGLPCAPAVEKFSKRLQTCCKARFGSDAVLPTRAFPGLSRVRVQ